MDTLRDRLMARQLTPEALAARMQGDGVDISVWSINAYIYGRRTPPIRVARALASALDCSLDDIADAVTASRERHNRSYFQSTLPPEPRGPE